MLVHLCNNRGLEAGNDQGVWVKGHVRGGLVEYSSGSVVVGNSGVGLGNRFGRLGLFHSQDLHPERNKKAR